MGGEGGSPSGEILCHKIEKALLQMKRYLHCHHHKFYHHHWKSLSLLSLIIIINYHCHKKTPFCRSRGILIMIITRLSSSVIIIITIINCHHYHCHKRKPCCRWRVILKYLIRSDQHHLHSHSVDLLNQFHNKGAKILIVIVIPILYHLIFIFTARTCLSNSTIREQRSVLATSMSELATIIRCLLSTA